LAINALVIKIDKYMNTHTNIAPPSKEDVTSDENVKYTNNTSEVRRYLESKGFKGLSFFQGKEFIYAFLTIRANYKQEWKEKDYSTFSVEDKDGMDFLEKSSCSIEEFKIYIDNLK
jgi:hypothetical protein